MTKLIAGPLAAMAFGFLALAGTANANEYPWCAQYTGGEMGGGRNCGFETIEQCRANVSGIGGDCVPNLFYEGRDAVRGPAKRHHKERNE